MILRYLFTLALCVAGIATSLAQTFQASALAGVNITQIDGDDLRGFSQFGFNGGLRVVAKLGDRWRVGPEILFSQIGSRRGGNEFNASNFDRVRVNTVEVPFMLYYKDWKFTAEAGLFYQRLINYRIEDSAGFNITDDIPFRDDFYGIQLGGTFYATENWGFNFRWSRHFSDLEANDGNLSLIGRSLTFRIIYTFGRGEEMPRSPISTE